MEFPRTKEEIIWNFSLANEFTGPRQAGYTFVIDVFDNAAKLALYHIKMNYSKSTTLDMQPPKDLLEEALKEQNSSIHHDGLYPINGKIRTWIENTMLA